jgi:cytochrome c oxidase subunit 4
MARHATGPAEEGGAGGHPSWKVYVLVGAVLTVITAAEVAVFYIPVLRPVLVPILLVLSAAKFALVVMFYMHLKFDHPIFRGVFVAPLGLAVVVVVALVVLFHLLPLYSAGGATGS